MTSWYHAECCFNALSRARASTKKIDSTDGNNNLTVLFDLVFNGFFYFKLFYGFLKFVCFNGFLKNCVGFVIVIGILLLLIGFLDIEGFSALKADDKAKIKKLIASPPTKAKTTGKRAKKAADDDDDDSASDSPPPPTKKAKATSSSSSSGIHAGRVFAITGTLSRVRKDIVKIIEDRGGQVRGTVTSDVTHLIAANPYLLTSKMEAAKAKGVEIVSEEFLGIRFIQYHILSF